MSETIMTAIVGGVIAIILLWMQNRQSIKMTRLTAELAAKQKETHDLVNSRMSELLELTRKSSKAEGKKEEKMKQKENNEFNNKGI